MNDIIDNGFIYENQIDDTMFNQCNFKCYDNPTLTPDQTRAVEEKFKLIKRKGMFLPYLYWLL